jgi:menaquinone-dependent protoporphyrinogen IX oxidase
MAADKKPVLLSATKSKYRVALIEQIGAALKKDGIPSTVVAITKLADIKAADYSAIVVIGSVPDWKKKGLVNRFVLGADGALKKKLVVVTAARKLTWTPRASGFHAITTASKKAMAPRAVTDAVVAVKALIKH